MADRLSTCGTCGATIKRCEGTGWWHMTGTDHGHRAEPDDGAVSGPDHTCEWCDRVEDDPCDDECGCPECEGDRLLDDEADAYAERCRD